MAGKFEIKKNKSGQFSFNLLASNGQVILTSELYKSKASAKAGVASVQKNAPNDAAFERKISSNNKSYFVLKAANKQIIGKSQMYESDAAMENGIESVKRNAPEAGIEDFTVKA